MKLLLNALIAAGLSAGVAAPALAQSYFFRTKPIVAPPQPFSFGAAVEADSGAFATSAAVRVKGYDGRTASVSGDSGASYQICSAADCSDQGSNWRTAETAKVPGDFYARVRVTAGTAGSSRTATLALGGSSATFTATARAAGAYKLVSSWVDSESANGEMPSKPWGTCDTDGATKVGIEVVFRDGLSGSATYTIPASRWNTSGSNMAASASSGFMAGSCASSLHDLYNNGRDLPAAWDVCANKWSNNFDLDYSPSLGSHFRANVAGWGSATIKLYCGK